ncbi:MAG: restriction endonuclease subunit S [Chitinophagales bacterium]|nr:restriction endonuclease subunit S [Chitinophagales bacterium]
MSKNNENKLIPTLRFPEFLKLEGWIDTELGYVAEFINGRAYKQEELLDKGKYKVLRVGNFFTNNSWYYSDLELEPEKYCDYGDLLYAWSASFGPRIWTGDKTIYHYHIWKVINNKNIDKQFLYVLLGHQTEKMKSQSANGFALLHITKGTIEKWKCSIPKSEKEQQKIAACLSSLDEVITAESEKLEILKDYKNGLLQNLLPQSGETVPKFRFKEFEDSSDWVETTLTQVADYENGKAHEQDISDDGKFIVVNSKFISQDGEVKKFTNTAFLPATKGDVLMVLSDIPNGKAIAKSFLVEEDNRYTVNQRICRITPRNVNSKILYYLLNRNPYFLAFDDGVKQTNLRKDDVLNCPLLIPSDPNEQDKIADTLSSVDELINAQNQKLEALQLHKKGLLQGLFPSINNEE